MSMTFYREEMERNPLNKKVTIFAHRGFKSKAPENTMIAFEMARHEGADGIELDIQKTKDGKLVVIHDETLERTTDGSGWVKDYDYESLSKFDAGSWFGPEFKREKIPLLDDVLIWAKQHNMYVNIELKTALVTYEGIEKDLVELIEAHQIKDQILCSSFNHYSLRKLKEIDPELKTAILYFQQFVEPWLYAERLGADAIHPYFKHIDTEILQGCKENNILLNPYTVNELEDLRRMITLGVDTIITDYPDRLKTLL